MASGSPSAQVQISVEDLVPPLMLTLYYLGRKLSGGGKIMRWQNNYPVAEKHIRGRRGWAKNLKNISQYRKLFQSTENTLFQILIHREISSAQNRTLSSILIHYRIYTLSWYIDEPTAETITYLKTLKKPKFIPKPNSCRQRIRIEHEKP